MPTFDQAFPRLCEDLAVQVEPPQRDGRSPFEAMIHVLLDRELSSSRAETAILAFDEAGLLSPERLAAADILEIRELLREKGISTSPHVIAPLQHLARWLVEHHDGRVDSLFNPDRSTDWLRGELSAVPGIGL